MSLYSLEKWYFDLDYGEGIVLGYLANLHLFGADTCQLTVVAAGPTAGSSCTASRKLALASGSNAYHAATGHGVILVTRSRGQIALDAEGLSVHLDLELADAEPLPDLIIRTPRSKGRIAWRPLALRARATGTVILPTQTIRVDRAFAYLDYLYSTLFPRLAPVKALLWGRLHHDDLALTYTVLEGPKPNERWSLMVVSEQGRVTALPIAHQFSACSDSAHGPIPSAYELAGTIDDFAVRVQILPAAVTLETPFTDDTTLGWPGQRLLAWLARHPMAVKHSARANVQLHRGGRIRELSDLPVFGESVTFSN